MQEKKALKEEKLKQEEKYMWAVVDGVKEKVNSNNIYLAIYFVHSCIMDFDLFIREVYITIILMMVSNLIYFLS